MVPTSHLLVFATMSLVLVLVPGPSVLFTISRALTIGRRGALLTVVGNTIGVYAQVLCVAFGLGAVVERSAQVFTVLKLLGAGYLVYLGVQAIRHRRALTEALHAQVRVAGVRRILADGFVVGVSNPKNIMFFVAVLPQFVDPAAGRLPLQFLLLGAVYPTIALLSDSGWAFIAGTARQWFVRSPRRMHAVGGTGGLVMIGLGASLALTGRKD